MHLGRLERAQETRVVTTAGTAGPRENGKLPRAAPCHVHLAALALTILISRTKCTDIELHVHVKIVRFGFKVDTWLFRDMRDTWSCYRNWDKLRPNGPLGSYADL